MDDDVGDDGDGREDDACTSSCRQDAIRYATAMEYTKLSTYVTRKNHEAEKEKSRIYC
jgi:hypothetical protein